MGLKSDIETYTANTFSEVWTTRKGTVVPESSNIALKNDAVELDGTVLYTDLDGSTSMVETKRPEFSAEVYKTFLFAAAKIISSESGVITSYDGDRVMAVFIGDRKNTRAVRAALKINYARIEIINKKLLAQYPKTTFSVKHVSGIDSCKLLVARTGIRGSNDLVWVGNAANYAAKLTTLSSATPTWITDTVYKMIADEAKYANSVHMWKQMSWSQMNNKTVYCSTYHWRIN